jgi:hypothetical protein
LDRPDFAPHLGPQLFGDKMCIAAAADDLWSNENNELGTGYRLALVRKGFAQCGNLIEQWYGAAVEVLFFLDHPGQQDRLTIGDGN